MKWNTFIRYGVAALGFLCLLGAYRWRQSDSGADIPVKQLLVGFDVYPSGWATSGEPSLSSDGDVIAEYVGPHSLTSFHILRSSSTLRGAQRLYKELTEHSSSDAKDASINMTLFADDYCLCCYKTTKTVKHYPYDEFYDIDDCYYVGLYRNYVYMIKFEIDEKDVTYTDCDNSA